MPRDAGDDRLLVKIARAYYRDGLTQKEIGERLGLSRIKVSRLLREARERHVVEIRIISSEDAVIDRERALEARYDLDEVLIAEPLSRDPQDVRAALGETAAQALLSRNTHVGDAHLARISCEVLRGLCHRVSLRPARKGV